MSTAEITAYLAGAEVAQSGPDGIQDAADVCWPDGDPIPDSWLQARARLGDERFAYWVLRGARDVLGL